MSRPASSHDARALAPRRGAGSLSIVALSKGDADTFHGVARLRYEVYVAEMGCRMAHADPVRRVVVDDLDGCSLIVVADDGTGVVGAARNTVLADLRGSAEEAFDELQRIFDWPGTRVWLESATFSSKLTVRHDYRRSTTTVRLASTLYSQRRLEGIAFDYLLAPSALECLYERLGYVRCAAPLTHPEAGLVVPMRIAVQDVARLERMRSPFARAVRLPLATPAREWTRAAAESRDRCGIDVSSRGR